MFDALYVTLFDDVPQAPVVAARRVRLRIRHHACAEYVRKVKGEKYQVRVWLAGFGSVNCGLYDEQTAEEVAKRVKGAYLSPCTPLTLWGALKEILAAMRAEGWDGLPEPEPLPRYVEAVGAGYAAKVRKGGRVVECPGPYASPEEAYRAMEARLAEEFPARTGPAVRATLAEWLSPHAGAA